MVSVSVRATRGRRAPITLVDGKVATERGTSHNICIAGRNRPQPFRLIALLQSLTFHRAPDVPGCPEARSIAQASTQTGADGGSPAPIYAQRTILLMRNRTKLLLTALAATAVLGALVATASANRIALVNNSPTAFRTTWSALEFIGAGGIVRIRCPVTIEGSFHSRTISKVLEALVGYVTRAAISTCTGGTTILLTARLPWHIRYNGFAGTLPAITSISLRLVGAEFLINFNEVFGLRYSCLYQSTAASPMRGNVAVNAGVAETLTPETAAIPLLTRLPESTGTCPSTGQLGQNAGPITLLGLTTKITVTLVQ
jgi:hypothetical protein